MSGLVHGGLRTIFLPPIEHALRDDTPYYRLPSTLLTKTRRLHGPVMRRPYRATVVPELAETHGHHKTHRYRERPLTSERAGRSLPETCGPDVDQSLGGLRSSQAVRQSANSVRSREPYVSKPAE